MADEMEGRQRVRAARPSLDVIFPAQVFLTEPLPPPTPRASTPRIASMGQLDKPSARTLLPPLSESALKAAHQQASKMIREVQVSGNIANIAAIESTEESIHILRTDLRTEKAADDLQLARGNLYLRSGRFRQAFEDAEIILGHAPCLVGAHILRGRALLEVERLDEAGASLTRALSLGGADPATQKLLDRTMAMARRRRPFLALTVATMDDDDDGDDDERPETPRSNSGKAADDNGLSYSGGYAAARLVGRPVQRPKVAEQSSNLQVCAARSLRGTLSATQLQSLPFPLPSQYLIDADGLDLGRELEDRIAAGGMTRGQAIVEWLRDRGYTDGAINAFFREKLGVSFIDETYTVSREHLISALAFNGFRKLETLVENSATPDVDFADLFGPGRAPNTVCAIAEVERRGMAPEQLQRVIEHCARRITHECWVDWQSNACTRENVNL